MAEPSQGRQIAGRVVDGFLSGSNYNRQTGQYSNVGRGLFGTGVKALAGIAGTFFGGPLVGKALSSGVGKFADRWVDTGSIFRGPRKPQAQAIPIYNPGMSVGGYQGGVTYPTMSLGFGGPPQTGGMSQLGQMVGNRMDAGVGRQLDATLARNEDRIGAELSANLAAGRQSNSGQPRGNVIWQPGQMMIQQNSHRSLMDQLSRQAAAAQSPYKRRA